MMKAHWPNKTLDQLERVKTEVLRDTSYLLITITKLRAKKPLCEFEIEDLRILIGQSIGLPFLIPLAIEELEKDILAEGDFYEGDLLKSVLTSDVNYWKSAQENWNKIIQIYKNNRDYIASFDTTRKIRDEIHFAYLAFSQICS
jgi:hypothetical protein